MRLALPLLALLLTVPATAGPDGPSPELVAMAREAVDCAVQKGRAEPGSVLTVIDYRRPSSEPRLWVLDADDRVLFAERVAHGKGSGEHMARTFSDVEGSHQSSLGLFLTAETYRGKHGYSLRLDGLEPGWNGQARQRAIVVHGADYATEAFVDQHGRLGRSWGCPAVRPDVSRSLIDTIANKTPLFAYSDDAAWLAGSDLLRCD